MNICKKGTRGILKFGIFKIKNPIPEAIKKSKNCTTLVFSAVKICHHMHTNKLWIFILVCTLDLRNGLLLLQSGIQPLSSSHIV
jgi:hypothetical protein